MSDSLLDCTVAITARPDIDGIGIRLATYCQLFIAIITLAIAPHNGIGSWWAVIITSLGLQVTAVVERQGLSLYHALIVTWLTFPVFMMTFYYAILAWGRRGVVGEVVIGMVLHGSLFVGFCFWVWGTAPYFGDDVGCNSQVKFALFSLFSPLGGVRGFALFVMSLFGLMMLLIYFVLGSYFTHSIAGIISPIMNRWKKDPTPTAPIISPMILNLLNHTPSLHSTVAVLTTINLCSLILSICQIESMIAANTWLITPGSEVWTFGQILSIILVANPLLNFFKVVKIEYDQKESLDKRPAAALVLHLHGKWKSARNSGFISRSKLGRRKDDAYPEETKSLQGLGAYPFVDDRSMRSLVMEDKMHDGYEKAEEGNYDKTLPSIPANSRLTGMGGYSTLRSFDDPQDDTYGRSRFSIQKGGETPSGSAFQPKSPVPSYHTHEHYATLRSIDDSNFNSNTRHDQIPQTNHHHANHDHEGDDIADSHHSSFVNQNSPRASHLNRVSSLPSSPPPPTSTASLSSPTRSPSSRPAGARGLGRNDRNANMHAPVDNQNGNVIPHERYNALRSFWDRNNNATTDSRRSRTERERDMFIS